MEKLTRRSFIGGAGALFAAGATVAVAGCSSGSQAASETIEEEPVILEADEVIEADIVVVGAGCSGLAACVQAADDGAKVICLEASNSAGGAAGGVEGIFGVGSKMQQEQGIEVSVGGLMRTEMIQNQYRSRSLALKDLVSASGDDIDWLAEHGVLFGTIDNYVGSQPIFHWFETLTGAESYIVPMKQAADEGGVEFIFETHADSLIQNEEGAISGVYASKVDGSILQVNAKAVILGTGGYAERMDYLQDFGYTEENTLPVTTRADGSGHDMAIACGAESYRQNTGILGRPQVPDLPAFFDGGYFNQVMEPVSTTPRFVWVNQNGERFVNEDLTIDNPMIGANPCRQFEHVYILLDEEMMNEYINEDEQGLKELNDAMDLGNIVSCQSWAELAAGTNMDESILKNTIAQYNLACSEGEDSDFGKKSEFLLPYATEGKVYAVEIKNDVTKTMGAVCTNRDFNAVNKEGEPIRGLYSVGVDGAMIWANVYTMNISGSCAANNVYSGRTAAKHAVQNLL